MSSVKVPITTIQVKVKPNARTSVLELDESGVWHAKLKAPPRDGEANEELIALVAERFHCAKSAVSIKSGASARLKLVRIFGVAALPSEEVE